MGVSAKSALVVESDTPSHVLKNANEGSPNYVCILQGAIPFCLGSVNNSLSVSFLITH
jgi:hypothetical protein